MAETCIVCLGDLAPHENPLPATDAALAKDGANAADNEHHGIKLEGTASMTIELSARIGGM